MNDIASRVSASGFLSSAAASGAGVSAGTDDDLGGDRLPDWAPAGQAHNAINARTATTLKLDVTILKTGRWFVMAVNPGTKGSAIVAPRSGIEAQI